MSIPDELIMDYFELLTDVSDEELGEFNHQLADRNFNPMALKKHLARELVIQLYSQQEASEAEEHFEKVVQKKEVPEEIEELPLSFAEGRPPINKLLAMHEVTSSTGEANRLILQGAVTVDDKKITSRDAPYDHGSIIKVGKRRYLKIINTDKIT